jgi:hypothetical protein
MRSPVPALVVQCGRGRGSQQTEVAWPGYGYKLLHGGLHEGWTTTKTSHCWHHDKEVRFRITLPPGTSGQLRLFFTCDNDTRRHRTTVQSRVIGDVDHYKSGKWHETQVVATGKDGAVEVLLQGHYPAIGTIEFIPMVMSNTIGTRTFGTAALVLQCGRGGNEGNQVDVIEQGYSYRLMAGNHHDGWGAPAARSYCWAGDEVRLELTVPRGTPGKVRLFFLDPDGGRKQRLFVQGKDYGEFENLTHEGKWVEVRLIGVDTKDGVIDVRLQKLAGVNAVLSTVEFIPANDN